MSVGSSGRIVIEVDPILKRHLYATLLKDGVTLKAWFLDRAESYIQPAHQLSLELRNFEADPAARSASKE